MIQGISDKRKLWLAPWNAGIPSKFCDFCAKSPSVAQRSVSQENAFLKRAITRRLFFKNLKYFFFPNWKQFRTCGKMHPVVTPLSNFIHFNPRPPEPFSVARLPKGGFLQLPWIFDNKRPIPLCLLALYSYGSPLSIDTKISTLHMRMTSLWHHNISATSKFWANWKYSQRIAFVQALQGVQMSWKVWVSEGPTNKNAYISALWIWDYFAKATHNRIYYKKINMIRSSIK